jgi:hypothetical protein
MPSTGTASGIVVPPTRVSVNTRHMASVLGATTTTRGRWLHCILRTFYYCGLRGVTSTPGAMVSPSGREADSSTTGDGFSSVAAVLGSSPSQDRSVDFLHNTHRVVSQAQLLNSMYYSGMDFTDKLDRTTVTVGAPSMLAMSTSPPSAGATSSAWAAIGSSATVVVLGSGLLSSTGACGSTTLVVRYVICDTSSSTVGGGLRPLSVGPPTVSQSSPSP